MHLPLVNTKSGPHFSIMLHRSASFFVAALYEHRIQSGYNKECLQTAAIKQVRWSLQSRKYLGKPTIMKNKLLCPLLFSVWAVGLLWMHLGTPTFGQHNPPGPPVAPNPAPPVRPNPAPPIQPNPAPPIQPNPAPPVNPNPAPPVQTNPAPPVQPNPAPPIVSNPALSTVTPITLLPTVSPTPTP